MVSSRQASGGSAVPALRHGPPLLTPRSGFAGTPVTLVRRIGPSGFQRPHRHIRTHVQNVVHSRRRQALPQRRRHPESGIASHPLCAEVASGLGHTPAYPWPTPSCFGTPAGSPAPPPSHNAPPSPVHSWGRYSLLSTSARPRGPTWAKNTPAWQLAIFPNAPQYCRATSRRLHPLLGKVAAVQHPHRLRMLQPRTQILLQPADDRVVIPAGFGKKTLQHTRRRCNRL